MGMYIIKQGNEDASSSKSWAEGIPQYEKEDVLTEEDKLNFAMSIVKYYELDKNGYKVVAVSEKLDEIPNFVCEKDGKKWFIIVRCAVAPNMPMFSDEQTEEAKKHAEKFDAQIGFAPVGIGSTDGERYKKGLALKGDNYYVNYVGLKKI